MFPPLHLPHAAVVDVKQTCCNASLMLQVGRLWCALADYYIRLALFERARDVYQEGVESVMTVRDFTLIFEALTSFEQALAEAQMAQMGDAAAPAVPEGDGADFLLTDDGVDIDLRLERLDWLYEERPKLLNSVMLRQNPHNVQVRPDPRRRAAKHAPTTYAVAKRRCGPAGACARGGGGMSWSHLHCAWVHVFRVRAARSRAQALVVWKRVDRLCTPPAWHRVMTMRKGGG